MKVISVSLLMGLRPTVMTIIEQIIFQHQSYIFNPEIYKAQTQQQSRNQGKHNVIVI